MNEGLRSPYKLSGASAQDEGQALAAAGVLEALRLPISEDARVLRARLCTLVAARPDVSFAWRRPQNGGQAIRTAAEVAAAWRAAFAEAGVVGPARLLVEADSVASRAELIGVLRRLQAPLLAQRGRYLDWRNLDPGVIAGVSVLPPRQLARLVSPHTWSWPLRIEIPRGIVLRGLERGFIVGDLSGSPDIALAMSMPSRGPDHGGVRFILDPSLDLPQAAYQRLHSGAIGRRPEALAPVRPEALADLLTSLSYEVAHDAPIDFALSVAWLRHGHGDLAPIFLAPSADWPAELEATRLRRRIAELAARLRRMPRTFLDFDGPLRALDLYVTRIDTNDLANRLERVLRDGTVLYDHESDAGTDLLTLDRALAAPRGPADVSFGNHPMARTGAVDFELYRDPPAMEAERFTDLVLHRGFHYGTATPGPASRLDDDEALQLRNAYTLEVAIRHVPIGVAASGAVRPVQAPLDRTDPGILAVVSCRQAHAPQFQDRLLEIAWPRDTDSTAALFRFQTGDELPPEPICVEIRVYARAGLQLLDLAELRFSEGRWEKHQPEIGRVSTPTSASVEDAITFHVAAKPGGYNFEVVFTRGGEAHLDAPLGRLVSDADIEALLRRVRSFWTRLVIGKLSRRPQLSPPGYAEEVRQIVDLGAVAWRTLFGDRRGAQAGTPEALGETLRRHLLPKDTPVRVTLANDADAFVFPWAILCPPLKRKETPDPEAIWGLRHRIELTRRYSEPYRRPAAAGKVRIAAVLDPGFADSVDHAATLSRVTTVGAGAELVPGVGTAQAVLDGLEARPPADVYYYFCHGFAPGRAAVLAQDLLQNLRQELQGLEDAAERRLWQALLDRLGEGKQDAAMFTGTARISEDDLRTADFFAEGRPIVFLNMCHSADLLPSLRSGLTRVFIDHNAAAVLGTECPVTSVFADMFAERVLGGLLCGATIGVALLEARRHFHAERNPLGLLYTLYGHDDARVVEGTHGT